MWSEIVRRYEYNFRNFSPFRSPHATESINVIERVLRHEKVNYLINSLMMKTTAQGRVVRFTPFRNFNFERKFQTIAGDNSHQSLRDSYFVQL